MTTRGLPLAALAATTLLGACVTSRYTPRPYPTVKQVMRDGRVRWVTGTLAYDANVLTDGLEEAVAIVPEARALAEEARTDAILGLVLAVVGPSVLTAGLVGVTVSAIDEDELSAGGTTALIGTTLAGVIATVMGLHYAVSSQALQMDAVNLYNDTLWARHMRLLGEDHDAPAPPALDAPPPGG